MSNKLWIIGCGDIGRRVVRLYQQKNNSTSLTIHALVSSKASKEICDALGIHSIALDLDHKQDISTVGSTIKASQLFYFAPPAPKGVHDTRLTQFLASLSQHPKRIVLISTTGVYGDAKGEWIDENFPLTPQTERAYRRLDAEHALAQWAKQHQGEIIILRVPGIYAKDRLPLARLKKGLRVVNQAEAGWTNRIHADDLAAVCYQAMASDINDGVYNVTDGHPSTMTEYFNHVAEYANLPYPPQISLQEAEATLSEGMVSYLKESRRIRNKKMLNELGIKLRYPSLAKGLKLC